MTIADIERGLKACREATTLPWRSAGDVLMSDGPFPDWFPEERVVREDSGESSAYLFDIKHERREDVAFVEVASELLPKALAALQQISTLIAQHGSISSQDFKQILNTPVNLTMEISDRERFNRRKEELFDWRSRIDSDNYVNGRYHEAYALLKQGDLDAAIANLEALAAEQRR